MAKVWLDERLAVLIPQLQALNLFQAEEIARLCEEEIAVWKARMNKPGSIRPVITAARKSLKQHLIVTPENRYRDPKSGEWWHIALKYLNLSPEEWDALNALSDAKFEDRLTNQQIIEQPQAIIARAEKMLHSERWEELTAALALVTGRRLTELLQAGRFFPRTAYTVMFDGQLKRRDLDVIPYEIPVLLPAELVLSAWRRLRALEDTSKLDIDQVEQKYSRQASETANRCFTGIIPQRNERENLYTHGFRAVYAQLAVHFFCPKSVNAMLYANTILGQHQAKNERQIRDFLTTAHYFDYYVEGGQGSRLDEPGIEVLAVFQKKGNQPMTDSTTTQDAQDTQGQQSLIETKQHKTRGTFTTKPGTYNEGLRLIEEREMQGTGSHDRLIVDLMAHDAAAHQMYALLQPLSEELNTDGPIATLQALIAAYRAGGSGPQAAGMGELLQSLTSEPLTIKVGEKPNEVEINSETKPVEYMAALVERDRKFKAGMDSRTSKLDVAAASMEDLKKSKAPAAATERFKRAIDAVIEHNNTTKDPLHQWYINAALIRDLVGGQNKLVQDYLATRRAEIDAHHNQYGLTPKRNNKDMNVADEIVVQ